MLKLPKFYAKICGVKSGFQILHAVEQLSSLFLTEKLKQGAHIHQICLPRACCVRIAVRVPANSSHMCGEELTLKGLASP